MKAFGSNNAAMRAAGIFRPGGKRPAATLPPGKVARGNRALPLVNARHGICIYQDVTGIQGNLLARAGAGLLACLWALPVMAAHDHADIRRAAERAAIKRLAVNAGRVEAVAGEIDSRLTLADCDVPLQATLPYDSKRKSRVTAEVRCTGSQPWKLYVPVRLQVWQKVLVASGPLQRGRLLTAGDMILAERTVSEQARGFMLEPRHAVGFRLKRSLSEGDMITPGALIAPPLIERGQNVTLEASSGALRVRMAGVALEDGLAGDIIMVENRESGRKVEGVVRSGKTVEVLLH